MTNFLILSKGLYKKRGKISERLSAAGMKTREFRYPLNRHEL